MLENNPNNLRVIKTARTEESINAAAREGFRPLLKAVEPSKEIHHLVAVYQNRITGEIELSSDQRWEWQGEGYELVLPFRLYYPYQFPTSFAAYLVPPDLEEGEVVWLEDIIEDIIAVFGSQGYHPRLEAYEAIWTNGNFKVLFDPKKHARYCFGWCGSPHTQPGVLVPSSGNLYPQSHEHMSDPACHGSPVSDSGPNGLQPAGFTT